MAYFDSIKIGGTIKQVQVVQELKALPSPVLETSPQLVKIGNDLYMRESKMGGAYGTYRFMLVPTNQQVYSVAFVSNGQTFGEIIINASGEMTYNNTLVYSNGNWINEAYKTIAIFDGNFTNALYSFLGNNAEKIINGYFKYIKVSSEGNAANIIYKEFDNESADFALKDGFTNEELETLLNDKNAIVCVTGDGGATYYIFKQTFSVDYLDDPDMSVAQVALTSDIDVGDNVFATAVLMVANQDGEITQECIVQAPATEPKIVDLNNFVPKTATQGTLERGALNVLQASNENYIVFNDEIFRLADKQHNAGYLVYSHNGHDTTGCFFQKCITITLSTRAWVLETQENQAKLTAGSNITIENNVISATGGGGTSDTAYVSDSTLYIEEGTTAGGGGSNVLVLDIRDVADNDFKIVAAMHKIVLSLTFEDSDAAAEIEPFDVVFSNLSAEEITNIINGVYDSIELKYLVDDTEMLSTALVFRKIAYIAYSTTGVKIQTQYSTETCFSSTRKFKASIIGFDDPETNESNAGFVYVEKQYRTEQ